MGTNEPTGNSLEELIAPPLLWIGTRLSFLLRHQLAIRRPPAIAAHLQLRVKKYPTAFSTPRRQHRMRGIDGPIRGDCDGPLMPSRCGLSLKCTDCTEDQPIFGAHLSSEQTSAPRLNDGIKCWRLSINSCLSARNNPNGHAVPLAPVVSTLCQISDGDHIEPGSDTHECVQRSSRPILDAMMASGLVCTLSHLAYRNFGRPTSSSTTMTCFGSRCRIATS